jgi:NADH-quinone oxidoreductase subunit M
LELLIIPSLFALAALLIPRNWMKYFGLAGGITSAIVAICHAIYYVPTYKYVSIIDPHWSSTFGLTYKMGYDGISLVMILLTNVITLLILLSNFNRELASNKMFTAMVFFMQVALLGVFTSMDGLLFYIFWEVTLIPVFLIALWFGAPGRKPALVKFFIYTFVGSLAMLLALMAIKTGIFGNMPAKSFAFEDLMAVQLSACSACWIFGGFLFAFAVKIPLFPFHTWQPDTYTNSPMAGTMLLSALMLKMALYGMIRWMIPLAPESLESYTLPIIILGTIGVVYAAILAIKQNDIKRTFAFASISHVGLIAAGIMLWKSDAMAGVFVQMINHSLVAVGLFLAVDVIERRIGMREMNQLGGIAKQAPKFAFWFGVVALASISVPLTSGFIGEFLLIRGVYSYNWIIGLVIGSTLVYGAVYTLRAYQLSMYGPSKNFNFPDLTWNEWLVFFLLMIIVVILGIYPQVIIDMVGPSVNRLFENVQTSKILVQ